jgi:hypothetical protein
LAYQCTPNNPFDIGRKEPKIQEKIIQKKKKKRAKNPKNPFFIASNKLENPFCSKVKRKEQTHQDRKARV